MLMNKGRHPYTDEVVVPEAILERVAYGRTVTNGKPEYSEIVGRFLSFPI